MHVGCGDVVISAGYEPGAIGGVTSLHGRYYFERWGFGAFFEAKVARELSDFFLRYDARRDCFLVAREGKQILGSITLDGGDAESPQGMAHLRWFIVAENAQGFGLGQSLIERSLQFAREAGFLGVYLWTFQGLHAAAKLYHDAGFRLAEQRTGETWGTKVTEQRFVVNFLMPAI